MGLDAHVEPGFEAPHTAEYQIPIREHERNYAKSELKGLLGCGLPLTIAPMLIFDIGIVMTALEGKLNTSWYSPGQLALVGAGALVSTALAGCVTYLTLSNLRTYFKRQTNENSRIAAPVLDDKFYDT